MTLFRRGKLQATVLMLRVVPATEGQPPVSGILDGGKAVDRVVQPCFDCLPVPGIAGLKCEFKRNEFTAGIVTLLQPVTVDLQELGSIFSIRSRLLFFC